MAATIDVQPEILNLELYAGDGVSIRFTCRNKLGAPLDLTGTVRAHIRVTRLAADPPVVIFTSNMVDAYAGVVILSLTGAQTQELVDDPSATGGKFTGVWDVEWDPSGSEPYTICQGQVECVVDVTR